MNIFLLILLSISQASMASPAAVKNEDGSFRLSDKSLKVMNIAFTKLTGSSPWSIPSHALVKIKFTEGVYRRYEGDITFVIVKVHKRKGNEVIVESPDLEAGDEVAISGTEFLRLTESDLNSDTVDSCAH